MIFEDVLAVLNVITDLKVISSEYNGKRPTKAYVTLRLGTARISPVHRAAVDENGAQQIYSHRYRDVQLQVYGEGSDEIAEELAMRMRTEEFLEQSEVLGLIWSEQIRTQYVPVLVDTAKYEPRTIIDVVVGYTANIMDDVGIIEHVRGTAELDETETPFAADI